MKFFKVCGFILLGIVIIVGLPLGYFAYEFNYSRTVNSEKQEFEIKSGEGVVEISKSLASKKIYKKPFIFRMYTLYSGDFGNLRAGTYEISPNLSLKKLVKLFVEGKISKGKVTIQEGWRINQVVDYLVKEEIVDREKFLEALRASLYEDLGFPDGFFGENLEGLLFPDTYYIEQNAGEEEIVRMMLENFKERTEDYALLQNSHGLTQYEVIILASIIEREAQTQEDRELVASVYLNRLAKGMKLEACPTVQYAKSDYWEEIDLGDAKEIFSAYNTYIHEGFPPTPISFPSLDSIQAVNDAPATNYYYFFNTSDGKMIFSETAEEHETKKRGEL